LTKEMNYKNRSHKKLGEMLIEYKRITSSQLKKTLAVQKNTGRRVGEILMEMGVVTQDEINWILSKQLDIPYVNIDINNIDIRLSKDIPEFTLRKYKALPILELNDELVVAIADPTDNEAVKAIEVITKRKIRFVLSSFKNINHSIDLIFKNKKFNANGEE